MKITHPFLWYVPRILSVIIVGFFAVFILEGFGPDFGWVDSLMHGLLALAVLGITIVAWKWPHIGGWIFIAFSLKFLSSVFSSEWTGAIIGSVPLAVGILFVIEGLKRKQKVPPQEKNVEPFSTERGGQA